MNIYCLSHSKIPSTFANSVHMIQMAQAFAKCGHDVTLFAKENGLAEKDCFAYYGADKIFSLKLVPLTNNKFVSKIQYVLITRKILKTMKSPDLFHVLHIYLLPFLFKADIPIIFEAHGAPANIIEKLIFWLILMRKNMFHLVANSNGLKKEFLRLYPSLSNKDILVAHNGANPITDENKKISFCISNNPSRLQAGYSGGLYSGRGIEIIIDLAKRMPDIDFHIAGGEPQDIVFWKRYVKSIDNLTFYGFIPPAENIQFLQAMDMLLAPYQSKVAVGGNKGNTANYMSPMKIFEYLSTGKPIIASNLPAIADILENNKDAILVRYNNISEWETAIKKLYDPELRKHIGTSGRKIFFEYYTWDMRARKIVNLVSRKA